MTEPTNQSNATIAAPGYRVYKYISKPARSTVTSGELGVRVLSISVALTAAMLFLPRLLLFAKLSTSLVVWPWQFDYDEGINLHAVMQLAKGADIYRHNGPEGFLSAPYPPIFYLLNAPFTWFIGPSFTSGRAISLLATLLIALLLAYIVRSVAASWWFGLLSGVMWLSLSPVIVWSAFYKQDMMALALGLAGLAWAMRFPAGRPVYVAAVLFALAFYTKQSALSAAAATTLWLLLRSRYTWVRFTLALLLLIPGLFLVANLLSGGGLWEHLVLNQALPWSVGHFRRILSRAWSEYWPLITLAGIGLVLVLIPIPVARKGAAAKRNRSNLVGPWVLVALYTCAGIVSSLVQIGAEGANFNHLLDGLLPICLVAGLSTVRLWTGIVEGKARGKYVRRTGLAITGLLLSAQLLTLQDPQTWFYTQWPNQRSDAQMRRLSTLVAGTHGDIYSEDLYLLLSTGHRVLYDDPSTLVPLANTGRWDESKLNQLISEHYFALVLFWHDSNRWTDHGLRAFRRHYSLRLQSSVDVYEPSRVQGSSPGRLQLWPAGLILRSTLRTADSGVSGADAFNPAYPATIFPFGQDACALASHRLLSTCKKPIPTKGAACK